MSGRDGGQGRSRGRRAPIFGVSVVVRTGVVTLVALVALLFPGVVQAQQGAAPTGEGADTTELVFEREVFSYPSFERRNPFRSLVGGDDGGPRFDDLRLLGILQSANPELSVALFGTGGGQGGQGGGQTYRVRAGQTLGNTRILDIQRSRVIVEVTEFGLTEQRVLELPRPNDGGTS